MDPRLLQTLTTCTSKTQRSYIFLVEISRVIEIKLILSIEERPARQFEVIQNR